MTTTVGREPSSSPTVGREHAGRASAKGDSLPVPSMTSRSTTSSRSASSPAPGASWPTRARFRRPATTSPATSATTTSSSRGTSTGGVHANLNMCRHRGNMMCKSEMGNASHFRCSYHGWTYKNSGELVGVPYMKEGYEGRLKRKDWGLVRVRVDTYEGLVFGMPRPGGCRAGRVPRWLPVLPRPLPQARGWRASRSTDRPTTGWPTPTGRSAPRTSPATATTPPWPTSGASTSATSPPRDPPTARAGRSSIPGQGARHRTGPQPELPAVRRLPRRAGRRDEAALSAGSGRGLRQDPDSGRHRLPEPVLPDAAVQPGPGRAGRALRDHAPLPPGRPGPHGDVLLVPGPEERLARSTRTRRTAPTPWRSGRRARSSRTTSRTGRRSTRSARSTMVRDIDFPVHHGDGQRAATRSSPGPATSSPRT